MHAISRHIVAVVLFAWLAVAAAGCNRPRTPVDFMGLRDVVGNLHPATRHYPYSCPQCPQYEYPPRAGH